MDEAPIADTLFRKTIQFGEVIDTSYVYVANPGCSFCIASALDCYRAYVESRITAPFLFLLKSQDTAVFDYYLLQSNLKRPAVVCEIRCADLTDALYTIISGRVVSITKWK